MKTRLKGTSSPADGDVYSLNRRRLSLLFRERPLLTVGPRLDRVAALYGVKRRRYFWIFPEGDLSLRDRILATILTDWEASRAIE